MGPSDDAVCPVAVLTGTYRQPELRLFFDRDARHPAGGSLLDWVRALPGRRWDPVRRCWVVMATGANPDRVLAEAGFAVELDGAGLEEPLDPSLAGVVSLAELWRPLVRRSVARPSLALVRPRLADYPRVAEVLGPGAIWDKARGRFEVGLGELLDGGEPKRGLVMDEQTLQAARETLASVAQDDERCLDAAAATVAVSSGTNDSQASDDQVDRLAEQVGVVPDWFGLDLYPYQRLGALACVAGRTLICDPTGTGKTRTALAALAIRDPDRAVVVVPPVVVTHWAREIEQSGVASGSGRGLVVVRSGRTTPELPDSGVVVVADSLLASRPGLGRALGAWRPGMLVYDEAHRARTWSSKRSKAMRDLCAMLDNVALRVAMTATPLLATPVELAGPLAISGHLDPVFGGYAAFANRYCRRNRFNAWVARTQRLPELRRILAEKVWVRRDKTQVLADLPAKSRRVQYVDVDLAGFRAAHRQVAETIEAWLSGFVDQTGRLPGEQEVEEYAHAQIGLMSPLRKAAGLAKAPVAAELVTDWLAENRTTDEHGEAACDRPLVVWAHHHEVVDALITAAHDHLPEHEAHLLRSITGHTPTERRAELVADFQAGRIGVLVCSISAAGLGITLTRACDTVFVETTWTPAEVAQAQDRLHRLGQQRPITATTLLAAGTLDDRIQDVLRRKARTLDRVLDDDPNDVTTTENPDESVSPAEIITDLVHTAVQRHQRPSQTAV